MPSRIEVWDFLEWAETLDTSDRAVQEVAEYGCNFDTEFGPDRLSRNSVSREQRRLAARMILFLRSDRGYEWPPQPLSGPGPALLGCGSVLACFGSAFGLVVAGLNAILVSIFGASVATLVWLSRESTRQTLAWQASGDHEAWPYFRLEDLVKDKTLRAT